MLTSIFIKIDRHPEVRLTVQILCGPLWVAFYSLKIPSVVTLPKDSPYNISELERQTRGLGLSELSSGVESCFSKGGAKIPPSANQKGNHAWGL